MYFADLACFAPSLVKKWLVKLQTFKLMVNGLFVCIISRDIINSFSIEFGIESCLLVFVGLDWIFGL